MKYKSGYKYQLASNEEFQTSFRPQVTIDTPYIKMDRDGLLTVRKSYAWDGPSGPTIDTPLFNYGSLVHDALYQLMRMQHIPQKSWRKADKELEKAIKRRLADEFAWWSWMHKAAWSARLTLIMAGLKVARGRAALPKNRKKILEA